MPKSRLRWTCPSCSGAMQEDETFLRCGQCGRTIPKIGGSWIFEADFIPSAFSPERREHLAGIEKSHFWFEPRRRLLNRILKDRMKTKPDRAIELGCGTGGFLPILREYTETVVGLDAYNDSLDIAHLKTPGAHLAQTDIEAPPLAGEQFGLVVLLDVLEHVDPEKVLRQAARISASRGLLLLSVPAFPLLWSRLDEDAGHRCRYRLSSLRTELESSGWKILYRTHYQAMAFPFVLLARKLGGRSAHSMERHPPKFLSRFFAVLNSLEVAIFGRWCLPWGSSLIVLAEKS